MPEKKKPLQATTDDAQQVQEGITPDNIAQEAEALLYSLLEPLIPFEMAILVLPAQKLSLIYYAAGNISQLSAEMQRILADPAQAEKLPKILAAADRRLLELIEPDSVADMPIILIDRLQQIADNAATLPADQRERLTAAIESIQEQAQQVQDAFAEIAPALKAVDARYNAFTQSHTADAVADILDLELFLQAELDTAAERAPELSQCTIWDVITEGFTKTGKPRKGKYYNIILAAIQARKKYRQAAKKIEQQADTPAAAKKITVIHTDNVGYPLDKPNSVLWDGLTGRKTNNQLQIATITIDTSRGSAQREAGIIYGISFDKLEQIAPEVTITKRLTQFDKRCYIAAAALYNAGNECTTATQIYRQMGNTGRPKAADLKRINDSLTKMGAARIYIDNTQEAQVYKGYQKFKYDAALLPFERVDNVIINGKEGTAIHFFREPPLMSFARERKQITTLELELLESPISKTEANLAIDDYLLERISRIKNGTAQPRILYETLYQKCNITTKMQKARAPEKIRRYLDHYQSKRFIYSYEEDAEGITVYVSPQVAAKASKKKTP